MDIFSIEKATIIVLPEYNKHLIQQIIHQFKELGPLRVIKSDRFL